MATVKKPRAPWAQWPPAGRLTTSDVSRVLKVSDRQVRAWAAAGELVGEEAWGGQWFFVKRDVVAFWTASGGRMARPGARATGQLALPLRPTRIQVAPKPQPWTWARFRPRMAKVALPDPEVNQARLLRKKAHVA